MTLRIAKLALVFAVAIFYSLVVLNNTTDYDSNYQFVRHVLMMDSTFPGNRGMWRAVNSPVWHTVFYLSIITWETATMILCWLGGFMMARALRKTPAAFHQAKRMAISALTVRLLMWQSKIWNGQDAAFRMFAVIGIILLLVIQPESEAQP